MKLKLLFFCATLFAIINLNAQDTTCYKKNWTSPATIENAILDGGECASANSVNSMLKKGWRIKDIKIQSASVGFNFTYIFTDEALQKSTFVNLNDYVEVPSFKHAYSRIRNVTEDIAIIDMPNLKVGQSGIIEHQYDNGRTIIVANGYVISSNNEYSTISLNKFDDLQQDAIPTANRPAQDGDMFVLNYLYEASLLIAPNSQSFDVVSKKFVNHKFLHSDIFATHLKLEYEPLPSKETFINFSKFQNIGTIFFVVDNKVYVTDAKTFVVLYSYDIMYQANQEELPFYTRVAEIDSAFWDIDFKKYIDFFKELLEFNEQTEEEYLTEDSEISQEEKDEELTYDSYYKALLGIK